MCLPSVSHGAHSPHPSLCLRLAQTWCDEEKTVKDINTDTIFTTDTPLAALLEGVAGTECEGVTEGRYFIADYTFFDTHFVIFLLTASAVMLVLLINGCVSHHLYRDHFVLGCKSRSLQRHWRRAQVFCIVDQLVLIPRGRLGHTVCRDPNSLEDEAMFRVPLKAFAAFLRQRNNSVLFWTGGTREAEPSRQSCASHGVPSLRQAPSCFPLLRRTRLCLEKPLKV